MAEETVTDLVIVPQERRQKPSLSVEAYQKLVAHFEQLLAEQTKGMCERATQERARLAELVMTVNQTQKQLTDLAADLNTHIESEHMELEQFKELRTEMQANTAATQDILSIVHAGKGFFKVSGWIFEAAKWTAGIVVAFGSVWFLFKDHHK